MTHPIEQECTEAPGQDTGEREELTEMPCPECGQLSSETEAPDPKQPTRDDFEECLCHLSPPCDYCISPEVCPECDMVVIP